MQRIEKAEQFKGEIYQYSFDLSAAVGRLGTTVSSVDWSTDDSEVTLGAEALASSVASCLITASNTGTAVVKCSATLADGQKIIRYVKIKVEEVS